MKDKFDNIEDLFKESFDHFDADVDPNMWSQISNQIGGSPAGQSAAGNSASGSSAVGAGVAKIAAVVGTAGILAYGGYELLKEKPAEEKTPVVSDQVDVQAPVVQNDELPTDAAVVETPSENITFQEARIREKTDSPPTSLQESKVEDNSASTGSQADKRDVMAHQPTAVNAAQPGTTQVKPVLDKTKETQKTEVKPDPKPVQTKPTKSDLRAHIFASSEKGIVPFEVQFQNFGDEAPVVSWTFRDNNEVQEQMTALHTFETAGIYYVVLEIEDQEGRITKDSVKITAQKPNACKVVRPSFSPNADGMHDAFEIECDRINSFHGKIFTKTGGLVFEWHSENGLWDGRDIGGTPMPAGTYYYVIETTDAEGQANEPIKGYLTLYR